MIPSETEFHPPTLKLSFSTEFTINLCIQNFISFLIPHLFFLRIEEQKKEGIVTKEDPNEPFWGRPPFPMSSTCLLVVEEL